MVYHSETPDLFNFKPEQTGIKINTEQWLN